MLERGVNRPALHCRCQAALQQAALCVIDLDAFFGERGLRHRRKCFNCGLLGGQTHRSCQVACGGGAHGGGLECVGQLGVCLGPLGVARHGIERHRYRRGGKGARRRLVHILIEQ